MRYIYAIVACFTLFVFYAIIGSILGWKSGGGAIPILIFSTVVINTWIFITKNNDRKWKLISQAEAEKNSLYGVKNWLAVFAFSVVLSPIYELATINTEAQKLGISIGQFFSLDDPAVNFVKLVIAVEILMSGIILWLLYSKHPKFRLVTSCILLSIWPLIALIGMANQFPEIGQILAMSLFPWVTYCVLWITYLQRSKRVRVTFEHCILPKKEGTIPNEEDHDDLYKTAYEETSSRQVEPAIWAKSFANAEGNQDKAKALYIKNRVEQLIKLSVENSQAALIQKDVDVPKIKISGYKEQNVWIFAIVGVVGVGLLVSQLQKPSENLSGISSKSSVSTNLVNKESIAPSQDTPVTPVIETRYYDNNNGTVTDLQTDLQWARCALGQEWKNNTCSGVANTYKWGPAQNELATIQNKGDWRIPTIEELRTLVYCSSGQPVTWNITGDKCQGKYDSPTIDSVIFPNTPAWTFWSSSNSAHGLSHAWVVNFGKGDADTYDKDIGGIHVRLVRGGKIAKQFEELLKKANTGDANAQNEVGVIYLKGQGVAQDDIEAVKWFRKAADQNQATAQFNLGNMYAIGRGVLKNDVEAVQWCRLAAEQGFVNAQNMMGNMYSNGRGVSKSQTEAIKWYRLAAEQGLAAAQTNLGSMYSYGNGIPKNQVEAVKWYRLAANQGFADAQVNMGAIYANGNGVPKDDAEAIKWLSQAAEQGNATAQYSLGFMYNNGRGVSKNDIEAVKWYRLAAEQGNAEAQNSLGLMYGNGIGVPQNYAEAMDWFRKAAKQEYAPAQYNIGYFYEEGLGVSKNFDGAISWYTLAAKQGLVEAKKALEKFAQIGTTTDGSKITSKTTIKQTNKEKQEPAKKACVYKQAMSNEDYRACGINLPAR